MGVTTTSGMGNLEKFGIPELITSDWSNHANHGMEIKAGNDMKMPVGKHDQIKKALSDGVITIDEIALCVKRILEMILWAE